MIGIFFSALAALFILFAPFTPVSLPNENLLGCLLLIIGTAFFVLFCLTMAGSLIPLQEAGQNSTPYLLSLFKKDKYLLGIYSWIVLFALLSYMLALDTLWLNYLQKSHRLALWVFSLGITLDIYYTLLKRLITYLNPLEQVVLFTQIAKESIQNDRKSELCEAVEALTETALISTHKMNATVCNHALQAMPNIIRNFLSSSKRIAHMATDSREKNSDMHDKTSYILYYIFERISLINEKVLAKKLEQVAATLVTVWGKIILHCARFDLTLASYPLRLLSCHAKAAINQGLPDIGVRASLTLLEISRTILEEIEYTSLDLKDPFFSLINGLEEITQSTFLQDKSINVKILMQPFQDLKDLFKNPKVATHQDTSLIIKNIDRVLGEYEALELVMKTIPPLPDISEEKSKI
ncbi:Uncharacterized protein NEOC65_002176 [Neochlamydia sp. AcF65]|uniref:hypothetical protein n=1 Tax=Neochlamydia sp. AcF65 TaxID=2795735 RepID=UPI001BC8CE3B|nr:hypothetical protein [Neochlamydia sp. AcF65]MBS4167070.1 Uncharacterized protein [Neochlamydia sp. AcF65]